MDRDQKVAILLERAEETRRVALDELDAAARKSNSWGSRDHRSGRERVETTCDLATRRYQALDERELDRELNAG